MSEYIRKTEVIRSEYADYYEGPAAEEFDRWLAAHDREVAAKAWDEGFAAGWTQADAYTNPYREEQ